MSPIYVRILIAASIVLAARPARAGEFTIQIANSVAAQSYQMKKSAFVFRTDGCVAPDKPEVVAKPRDKSEEPDDHYRSRSQPLPLPAFTAYSANGLQKACGSSILQHVAGRQPPAPSSPPMARSSFGNPP